MPVISISRISVALALLWLGAAGAAQEKKAAAPAKTPEAERKAEPSSEKSAEIPEVKMERAAATAHDPRPARVLRWMLRVASR